MRPTWMFSLAWTFSLAAAFIAVPSKRESVRRRSQRLGTGHDLDQLLGDLRLAGAVVEQGEVVDHLAGVARRVVHRGHARALLARRVLDQRPIDLYREVARQQLREDRLLVRLELVDRGDLAGLALDCRRLDRDQLLEGQYLGDRRAEAVEHDGADVELAGLVHALEPLCDRRRLVVLETAPPDP